MLDALANSRSASGLPGLSVNWGVLGDVGWVAQNREIAERLRAQGTEPISPRQATDVLGEFLQRDLPQIGALRIDWRHFGRSLGDFVPPRFAHLVPTDSPEGEGRDRRKRLTLRDLLDAAVDVRRGLLSDQLGHQVARVLGIAPEELSVETPLPDLGFDSLMAVELRNWIEGDLRLNLPVVELMHGTSVTQLVELLMKQLDALSGSGAPDPALTSPSDPAEPVDAGQQNLPDLDAMSDEEVDAMLEQLKGAESVTTES